MKQTQATAPKTTELEELARLSQRSEIAEHQVAIRTFWMNKRMGVNQAELAVRLGRSQSSVSRMLKDIAKTPEAARILERETAPVATAMELVRRAGRGEIDHEDLIRQLRDWEFDTPSVTHSLLDEWQLDDNSTRAILTAYLDDLITENEYEELAAAAGAKPADG